jgi:hypothetical protein
MYEENGEMKIFIDLSAIEDFYSEFKWKEIISVEWLKVPYVE